MRTRNQAKRHEESLNGTGVSKEQAGQGGVAGLLHGEGSIGAVSEEAVGRLLMRSNSRKPLGSSIGRPRSESHYTSWEARDKMAELSNGKRKADEELASVSSVLDTTGDAEGTILMKKKHFEKNVLYDTNELDWEDGIIPSSESGNGYSHELGKEVTIEFSESPSTKQRPSRRFSVEDKELAEIVHKVHLLCLIARGRLVDSACNDPLIQASLLSLLPLNLLKKVEVSRFTANELRPLVDWFRYSFRLKSESIDRGCFKSNLASALDTHEGTSEEIAALSVAFFRALKLTTRFVSNLDVVSLKPDVDMPANSSFNTTRLNTKIFSSISSVSSPKVHTPDHATLSDSRDEAMHPNTTNSSRFPKTGKNTTWNKKVRRDLTATISLEDEKHVSTSQAGAENLGSYNEGSKRKGDLEFELQMAMALSATATTTTTKSLDMDDLHNSSSSSSPMKKVMLVKTGESLFSASHSSGGVWSRKNGPPLYWAEVYCCGETVTGKWVHVDVANDLVDGEENVEPAAAVCKKPLRYVVAFAGNGAKDVTRRYCRQWYRIAPLRINPHWWDAVLAPLKELESGETGGIVHLEEFQENVSYALKGSSEADPPKPQMSKTSEGLAFERCSEHVNMENKVASKQIRATKDIQTVLKKPNISTRNSLEDMELETRTLTEPLPTNQLAYKNHHLYAIEKWLIKYQTLHPKGPIVGYCSGHPVYPRSCVQTVQTRQKWLREGLQIRENEVPAKVIKYSKKIENDEISDAGFAEEDGKKSIELFGRWQVEQLQLPHAVNGVVPKNEYGRVDVWSEKCLPHGTVHLRLPRLASVARRLEIDFANAMVGFEFRNGRSFPVYEGIVVCTEFRDAIMEAYAEEEEMREAEEKRKNEADALLRWFQLLSSIITRQRLESSYAVSVDVNSNDPPSIPRGRDGGPSLEGETRGDNMEVIYSPYEALEHEHVFSLENQSLGEESLVRTKRCTCGFSIQVEEL